MIFSAEDRKKIQAAESRWLPKFILRIITFVLALVSLIIALVVWVKSIATIWLVIPLGCSITWNLANLLVRTTRTRQMHPGANVACDLLLWIGFAITIPICILLNFDLYFYDYLYDPYTTTSTSYNSYGTYGYSRCSSDDLEYCRQQRSERSKLVTLNYAACGVAGVVTILHFTLFCWACADESKRRGAVVDNRAAALAATMVQQMQTNGQLPQQQPGVQYPPGAYTAYQGPQQQRGFQGYPTQAPQWAPGQQPQQGAGTLQPEKQPQDASQQNPHHGFYAPESTTVYGGQPANNTANAPAGPSATSPTANVAAQDKGKGKERQDAHSEALDVDRELQPTYSDGQPGSSRQPAINDNLAHDSEPGVAR